jgi:hypothetical protein
MPTPDTAPRSGGLRLGRWFTLVLATAAVLAGLYTWLTLTWNYSEGERAGLLQKFSRKGWICKTYEGELALYVVAGVAPEIWNFSVRDPALARQLAGVVGQRVQLHYSEHRGVPTACFGETGYYVDKINTIGEPPPVAAPLR